MIWSLGDAYPDAPPLIPDGRPSFDVLSTGQLAQATPVTEPAITLILHRVTHNEHVRALGRVEGQSMDPTPLTLDLHFLLTIWATNARAEQVLMAWASYQLFRMPILDRSVIGSRANWHRNDAVQLVRPSCRART